jgi:hypothetical protein
LDLACIADTEIIPDSTSSIVLIRVSTLEYSTRDDVVPMDVDRCTMLPMLPVVYTVEERSTSTTDQRILMNSIPSDTTSRITLDIRPVLLVVVDEPAQSSTLFSLAHALVAGTTRHNARPAASH